MKTARDRYNEIAQEVKLTLEEIKQAAERFDEKAFSGDSTNWGHVGSMGHVLSELKDIRDFIR